MIYVRCRNSSYNVAFYVRLSKEDLDNGKNESNSITNQNELIKNFLQSHPEIKLVKEYADDGFSGVNFERPDFIKMMEDVRAELVNCIVVKDLSRFGRNYIEVGKYMEEIFPLMGVRFISIIENYDSFQSSSGGDQLVIPFMNLVNDAYCGEASTKTRTSLMMKKQNGEYVGAFPVYGYKRDLENHHRLVIDEDAAIVVKRIFKLCIEGMSNGKTAGLLNREGVPCPMEYKKMQGENYFSGFQTEMQGKWSALAIRRILTNRVYIGVLKQGKTYSINYKLKTRLKRNDSEWFCNENAHEAIISKEEFYLVQRLLMLDSRTSPHKDKLYTFSGMLYCGKCAEVLIRRKKVVKGKPYVYYGCYDKNKRIRCESICIREDFLEKAVMETLQRHIDTVVEMSKLLEYLKEIPLKHSEVRGIDKLIAGKEKEVEKYRNLKIRLYEDYHEGFIGKKEYKSLESIYDKKEEDGLRSISELIVKRDNFLCGKTKNEEWLKNFTEYKSADKLDRTLLLSLVEKIIVYSKNEIKIYFCYQNEFETVKEILKNARVASAKMEVLYG